MADAGGMNAAETKYQKEKGIKDTVALMIEDTMKGGNNANDPELVKILAQNSAGSVDWLTSLGADLSNVGRMAGDCRRPVRNLQHLAVPSRGRVRADVRDRPTRRGSRRSVHGAT